MSTHSFPFHPHLNNVSAVQHGGAAQLISSGLNPEGLIDFSANILPIETPLMVKRALQELDLRPYPDPNCTLLKEKIADLHNVPADHIVCANGSVELIGAIVRSCLKPSEKILVIGPTFGEYEAAIRLVNGVPIVISTTEIATVLDSIETHRPKMVFLCNPNNPTGHLWSNDEIDQIVELVPLVLDEAYASFLRPPPPPFWGPGKIVLRSLTKDHALAGVRIGYAIAPPSDIKLLSHSLTPWGVSTVAQEAALAALSNPTPYQTAIEILWGERERLIRELKDIGLSVVEGKAPFFLIEVENASSFSQNLLSMGIVVRDCTSFGLPNHIRISPKTPREGDALISDLKGERTMKLESAGKIRLVLGGARSGKSEFAEQLAVDLGGDCVSYIATAQAFDSEMEERIQLHQQRRFQSWETVECPFEVAERVLDVDHPIVLLDCLTLLLTNWFLKYDSEKAEKQIHELIQSANQRDGTTIIVSNEIGSGIVPMNSMARQFRDLQGKMNKLLADSANEVVLVVAGQPIYLK